MSNLTLLILAIVLVLFSAFFSMSEICFSSCDKFKVKTLYESNPKKYKTVYKVSENFSDTISTILVGNNLVNIAASSIATVLCIRYFGNEKGPFIATLVITLIILMFGEILPKLIGSLKPNSFVLLLAAPLSFIGLIFKPITFVVNKFINWLSPLWKNKESTPSLTDEELKDIVEEMEDNKEIDEDESDLIKNAIEFKDTTAYDIMTPRVDIIAFDINDDVNLIKEDKSLQSRSTLIIYEDTIDNVIGYVDIKDILKCFILNKEVNIKDFLKDVLYVNETKKIDDLLYEMKTEKYSMAVVVDEFGGTYGIVKIEDILEELVGDIWDEKDKIEYEYRKISSRHYIVKGDMNIEDFFDLIEFEDSEFESEYSTISGWISELLDKVPEVNDKATYKNLTLKVISADETTANKIDITIKKQLTKHDD